MCRGSSGEVAARTTAARDRGERRWRSNAATPWWGGGMEGRCMGGAAGAWWRCTLERKRGAAGSGQEFGGETQSYTWART
jgi:hypothetical protein